MKVIEELRVENTPLSTSIADHIESFTDYDFAHLLFSEWLCGAVYQLRKTTEHYTGCGFGTYPTRKLPLRNIPLWSFYPLLC